MKKLWVVALVLLFLVGLAVIVPCLRAGEKGVGHYQVLAPIRNGNLTIFPVVAETSHDTAQFLTLDEGLRTGDVVVTEAGSAGPLVRPRPGHPVWNEHPQTGGAEVNKLVLINNSKRPLLLLAGEIVTGGKQDRIIGKDRLVPAESDPVDLSVFCVEPGRWVGTSGKFGAPMAMVQPSVRAKAMADKDQQKVWNQVAQSRTAMADAVQVVGGAAETRGELVVRCGGRQQSREETDRYRCRSGTAGIPERDSPAAGQARGRRRGRGEWAADLGRRFCQLELA
jgi:ARG and Rhodanese-Phosphatase-superfamily-associated Protein domain